MPGIFPSRYRMYRYFAINVPENNSLDKFLRTGLRFISDNKEAKAGKGFRLCHCSISPGMPANRTMTSAKAQLQLKLFRFVLDRVENGENFH